MKVDTSVRKGEITFDAALAGPGARARQYTLRAAIRDRRPHGRRVHEQAVQGRRPEGRPHRRSPRNGSPRSSGTSTRRRTPYDVERVAASRPAGKLLDAGPARALRLPRVLDRRPGFLPERHAHLPLRRAAGQRPGRRRAATYDGAEETPAAAARASASTSSTPTTTAASRASHLSFAEILRAADDVGMLVSFSQPHFGQYDWKAADADATNGYARHAEFYVRAAAEPSVGRVLLHEPQRHRLRRGHEPGP